MKQPLPHQLKFLEWAKGRKRIGVFMRMRLGKTFSTLRWARNELESISRDRPVRILIIAPNPVLPGWEDELHQEGQNWTVIRGGKSMRRQICKEIEGARAGEINWWLINPEGFRVLPEIAQEEWDMVIIDESTVIAKPKPIISRMCAGLFVHVPYKAILSGMPAPEGLKDYFNQMRFLNGEFMGYRNFWAFRQGCFIQAGYEWVPKRGIKDRVSKEIAKYCYVLNEKQAGLKFKKVYENRYVELPSALRGLYKRAWKQFELGQSMTKWTVKVQTWLQQISGGCIPSDYSEEKIYYSPHKLKELAYLLNGELKDRQVVVFFRFIREINHAKSMLEDLGIPCAKLSGAVPQDLRKQRVQRFQSGKTRVLLCQSRLVRFGLDFSQASVAIFYSNAWDGETRDQCEARTHHPGKREPTLYIDIITRGTTDESAVKALKDKIRNSNAILKRIFNENRSA